MVPRIRCILPFLILAAARGGDLAAPAWEKTDAAAGTVREVAYHSMQFQDDRTVVIYAPPGYSPSATTRYPVLYLLHGAGGNEQNWTRRNAAATIADNLIAQRRCVPLIMVMPLSVGRAKGDIGRTPERLRRNAEEFKDSLRHEIMPLVQREYAVSDRPEDTAIAGLSRGGAEALWIGLNAPERFGWIGGFGAGRWFGDFAVLYPHLLDTDARRPHLLWLSWGADDRLVGQGNRDFHTWLEQHKVPHVWRVLPGAHDVQVWRASLAELLPRLFQPAP